MLCEVLFYLLYFFIFYIQDCVVSEEIHNLFSRVNEQVTKMKHCMDLAFVQMYRWAKED